MEIELELNRKRQFPVNVEEATCEDWRADVRMYQEDLQLENVDMRQQTISIINLCIYGKNIVFCLPDSARFRPQQSSHVSQIFSTFSCPWKRRKMSFEIFWTGVD
jgi:hypothetical protein